MARAVLAEGEVLRVLCSAAFLQRVYAPGYLVLTDRRLLRLHPAPRGAKWATLAEWSELSSVEVTVRQASRRPLAGLLLRALGVLLLLASLT